MCQLDPSGNFGNFERFRLRWATTGFPICSCLNKSSKIEHADLIIAEGWMLCVDWVGDLHADPGERGVGEEDSLQYARRLVESCPRL